MDLMRPRGGHLGMIIGGSGLVGAWITRVLPAAMGADPTDILFPAVMAVFGIGMILGSSMMVMVSVRGSQDRGRRFRAIMIGLAVASGFSARISIEEVSRRSSEQLSSVSGLADPIVGLEVVLTGIMIDRDPTLGGDPILRATARITKAKNEWLRGRIARIRVDRYRDRLEIGDRVDLHGRWQNDVRPRNPGEPVLVRSSDQLPGTFVVPHPDLLEVIETGVDGIAGVRSDLRVRWWSAVDALVETAIESTGATAGGLIDALLTGRRDRIPDRLRNDAVRAGLAHLLAISGLHIGIIAGLVMIPFGAHRFVGRVSGITAVMAFALVVDPGPSVERSAWMAGIGGVILLAGRRVRGRSLVLIVLAGIVWSNPEMVGRAGFDLTAIATIGLVWSSKTAGRRWFGRGDRVGIRRSSFFEDRFTVAAAAGIVAWISTLPLVMTRFGSMSLIGVPATLVAAPILVVLLATSIVAGTLEVVLPGSAGGRSGALAMLPAVTAAEVAGGLADLVHGCGRLVDPISVATCSIGERLGVPIAVSVAIALGVESTVRRWSVLVGSTILLVTITSGTVRGDSSRMIHMLSVGDGTAIVVQDGSQAIMFDAGSSSIGDVGRRVLVPTLRRLGVRRLDAIIVSHANSDHYGGVIDLVDLMPVDHVIIGTSMELHARVDPSSVIGRWMNRIEEAGVGVRSVERGDEFETSTTSWRVLHPVGGEPTRSLNDGSLVIVMETSVMDSESPPFRLLLCGDIQREGIGRLLSREMDWQADVMELPHHGSWNPVVVALLNRIDPPVVLQSTGPTRWRRDRFSEACRGRVRLVTCRDGLISIALGEP